jgi:uncharacterized protein (DUF1330 family)
MTVYYTQLVFVREGKEETFASFEEHVLPLLSKYNGELLYRVGPRRDAVIESTIGRPYEVNVISFAAREDFDDYACDEKRQKHLPLKDDSVERILLVEGSAI